MGRGLWFLGEVLGARGRKKPEKGGPGPPTRVSPPPPPPLLPPISSKHAKSIRRSKERNFLRPNLVWIVHDRPETGCPLLPSRFLEAAWLRRDGYPRPRPWHWFGHRDLQRR